MFDFITTIYISIADTTDMIVIFNQCLASIKLSGGLQVHVSFASVGLHKVLCVAIIVTL